MSCVNSIKRTSVSQYLDKTGMWTSAICAVHCLMLPALLSFSAFSGLAFLEDPVFENTILIFSALIATSSLFPSFFKHHRNVTAIGVLLIGFLLIGLSRFIVKVNESTLTSSGAAIVASAHFINFRLCKRCQKKR